MSSSCTLRIQHIPGTEPPSFRVVRLPDGRSAATLAAIPSPDSVKVADIPNSNLLDELRWYLEHFLDYPFDPEIDHAERVQEALKHWGEEAFDALFNNRTAGRFFDASTEEDYADLHLQIASDDPAVLSWPWEALRDPEVGFLAHTCQIERCLDKVRDPQPPARSLAKNRVNILLVVARPYEGDVSYRSLARPLVELIKQNNLPASVNMLRPPTFKELRRHLESNPGYYHILHFDGHGAFGKRANGVGLNASYTLLGEEGSIVFESEQGQPDPINAEQLSVLLREHAVPVMVLNACQSAMINGGTGDPFAAVATALLRAGMRTVVAMAYSLYVSGAQQFIPAFYRRFFETGKISQAMRAGRQQMLAEPYRVCVRGKFPLADWLLPVLYQQDPLEFSFRGRSTNEPSHLSKLSEQLPERNDPYGFVGRDNALLALERAMRRSPAAILIHGLSGVGKTTLARGFLEWLDSTDGLGDGVFWFSFQNIHAAEYLFNRIGEAIINKDFPSEPLTEKVEKLAAVLNKKPFIIVWDNFESASGIENTSVTPNLSDTDRDLLAAFLDALKGGLTKVIVTSRSTEEWLGPQRRFLLPLTGLEGEERWEYCNLILQDLGQTINREDKALVALLNMLEGHPFCMRVILPKLESIAAAEIVQMLNTGLTDSEVGDTRDDKRLFATLRFGIDQLPTRLTLLLSLFAFHRGSLDRDRLQRMATEVDPSWNEAETKTFISHLEHAGMVALAEQHTYSIHPAVSAYLAKSIFSTSESPSVRSRRAFVKVMAIFADRLALLEIFESRDEFERNLENFYVALEEAGSLQELRYESALVQAVGAYQWKGLRNHREALRLFRRLYDQARTLDDFAMQSSASHSIGTIYNELQELALAEEWYTRASEIADTIPGLTISAKSYDALGTIASKRGEVEKAISLHKKALNAFALISEDTGIATSCYNLGNLELDRNPTQARQWLIQCLEHCGRADAQDTKARSYHSLGMLAAETQDFQSAMEWYQKSLAVSVPFNFEETAASTYHQVGVLMQRAERVDEAYNFYLRSAEIKERLGLDASAATSYQQLGNVSQIRGDLKAAKAWYEKALEVKERYGDKESIAITQANVAILNLREGNTSEAAKLCLLAAPVLSRSERKSLSTQIRTVFRLCLESSDPESQKTLLEMWQHAGLDPLK